MWSGHRRASRHRRRSRSSSRCHYRMAALRDWSGHSCHLPPSIPLRCHCWESSYPGANTMPKLASAVNVPSYAWSSCSGGGMARASLEKEDAWEDDFQTLHMPQPWRGWNQLRGAPAGNRITKWMLVRRRWRHLSPSILIVGQPTGSKWWSRASLKRKCPGTS